MAYPGRRRRRHDSGSTFPRLPAVAPPLLTPALRFALPILFSSPSDGVVVARDLCNALRDGLDLDHLSVEVDDPTEAKKEGNDETKTEGKIGHALTSAFYSTVSEEDVLHHQLKVDVKLLSKDLSSMEQFLNSKLTQSDN
ncbi:hypothetical protein GUJ93_ZPchr0008g12073 [Zizania palustris]|uniref:Uncharacterized protein n=1 Tax=Zizania palustris TaxID=103762 RepID=A0A8J5V1L9_ZIZPA|nr:hypothetical protein GUJ93_ZPchr0008g12073 [Zizania palustris]